MRVPTWSTAPFMRKIPFWSMKRISSNFTARRSREGPAARWEEQTLLGNSARKMNLARGDFRVNAHDP